LLIYFIDVDSFQGRPNIFITSRI